MRREQLPVAVIGAGPIGLATATYLAERNLDTVILESGTQPATHVAEWGHVRLFTPWRLNVDEAAERLLERSGWVAPDLDAHPTGTELWNAYLLPLSEALVGAGVQLELGSRVVSVTRLGCDRTEDDREAVPFELAFERDGRLDRLVARAVVDASGSWGSPNPLGAAGTQVPGERELGEWISYGIPDVLGSDRGKYEGRRTLVVGSGHSAMNVVIDLSRLADEAPETQVAWAIRRPASAVLGGDDGGDPLPARAALANQARQLVQSRLAELLPEFQVQGVDRSGDSLVVAHARGELEVEQIIAATGVRPDLDGLRELRLSLDPVLEAPAALAPLIDPRVHSCATVPAHGTTELSHPERDFYLAGMKSYGRAPTFLMATGYHQARSIAAALDGVAEPAETRAPSGACCGQSVSPTPRSCQPACG